MYCHSLLTYPLFPASLSHTFLPFRPSYLFLFVFQLSLLPHAYTWWSLLSKCVVCASRCCLTTVCASSSCLNTIDMPSRKLFRMTKPGEASVSSNSLPLQTDVSGTSASRYNLHGGGLSLLDSPLCSTNKGTMPWTMVLHHIGHLHREWCQLCSNSRG